MWQRAQTGASGGGAITLDTAIITTSNVSTSNAYTFPKDYDYVVVESVSSSVSGSTWYETLRLNGSTISDITGGVINNSMSSGSYTLYAGFPNVKSGDELKVTNGTWKFMILGFD